MGVWKNRRKGADGKGAGGDAGKGGASSVGAGGGLFDGMDSGEGAGSGPSDEADMERDIEYLLGDGPDGEDAERGAAAGAGTSASALADSDGAESAAGVVAGPDAAAGSASPEAAGDAAIGSDAAAPTDAEVSAAAKQIASSALAGLGVDIIEISRMENVLARNPHFKERVFSQMERDYCESKPNPTVHYALCFAAKEAVLKALGTGFKGMGLTDVQVAHDSNGKPSAVLSGNAKKLADEQQIAEVFLSLSYTHTTGVASAVAAREENIPPKSDAEENKQKLDAQFKRMKQMLDEIDEKLDVLEGRGQTGGKQAGDR